MACSRQRGVAPFLDFIEETTGERIKQSEWHAIRKLAETEYSRPASRSRVSNDVKTAAARGLANTIFVDEGVDFGEESGQDRFDASYAKLEKEFQDANVTQSTVMALTYLEENGVTAVLESLREPEADIDVPAPTRASLARAEAEAEAVDGWTVSEAGKRVGIARQLDNEGSFAFIESTETEGVVGRVVVDDGMGGFDEFHSPSFTNFADARNWATTLETTTPMNVPEGDFTDPPF